MRAGLDDRKIWGEGTTTTRTAGMKELVNAVLAFRRDRYGQGVQDLTCEGSYVNSGARAEFS